MYVKWPSFVHAKELVEIAQRCETLLFCGHCARHWLCGYLSLLLRFHGCLHRLLLLLYAEPIFSGSDLCDLFIGALD